MNISLDFGALFGGVIAFFTLIYYIRKDKKSDFISAITSERLRYIHALRELIAQICSLVQANLDKKPSRFAWIKSSKAWEEDRHTFEKLRYQCLLYLNTQDEFWEKRLINLIDKLNIFQTSLEKKDIKDKLNELILLSQHLLCLEWDGVKLEAKKGILSNQDIDLLNQKHQKRYLNSMANQGQTTQTMEEKKPKIGHRPCHIRWTLSILLLGTTILGSSIGLIFPQLPYNWLIGMGIGSGVGLMIAALLYLNILRQL